MVCLGRGLFGFILFGTFCPSCTWYLLSSLGFGSFHPQLLQMHFQLLFSFLSVTPIMCPLSCLKSSHRSHMLHLFFHCLSVFGEAGYLQKLPITLLLDTCKQVFFVLKQSIQHPLSHASVTFSFFHLFYKLKLQVTHCSWE